MERASLESEERILVRFADQIDSCPETGDFTLTPSAKLNRTLRIGPKSIALIGGPFDMRTKYRLQIGYRESLPVLPDGILNRYTSDASMGIIREGNGYTLRFFAPRVTGVTALLYHEPDQDPFVEISLAHDPSSGTWDTHTESLRPGDLAGYRVTGSPAGPSVDRKIFADPWSLAVTKQDDWRRRSLSVILPDEWLQPSSTRHIHVEPRDRFIYEAHLKDVSSLHPKVPRQFRGSYYGAIHNGDGAGGFHEHLQRLGVNTVEWLPLADYDHKEPPYGLKENGHQNTWNRYSFNHWGYMPAYWFAPESRYSTDTHSNGWLGRTGEQVMQLQRMINRQHELGFSVLVDVVYNHVAQYGENPIREIDPHYALRHDNQGNLIVESGCGNDLATERPMIRRLIVDSLQHWMTWYGVDGFRFDLAGLIDEGTLDAIGERLRGIEPDACLIAEPWGGLYDKHRYNVREWASWNDNFRDGLRGFDPKDDRGALFGNKMEQVSRHVLGDLYEDGGPYPSEENTVNYLSSHDGYSLGDFIRIALAADFEFDPRQCDANPPLSHELAAHMRLSYLLLMCSHGMVMLHEGDEYARCKRIVTLVAEDPFEGTLDHDSYNKDNPTNWLDWSLLDEDSRANLVAYLSGLAVIRKHHSALRLSRRETVSRLTVSHASAAGWEMVSGVDRVIVLTNFSRGDEAVFNLPSGRWVALADNRSASGNKPVSGAFEKRAVLPAISGMILVPSTPLNPLRSEA